MPSFQDIKYAFFSLMSTIEFKDIIDLVALTYIIYLVLKLVRETRAGQLIKGICRCLGTVRSDCVPYQQSL